MKRNARIGGPKRQRGIIVVATTIAMLALVLVAGYSLNSGHMLLNKTRIQNLIDTAALSAAKELDVTKDTILAEQAAVDSLTQNLTLAGYNELAKGITEKSISLVVEFSDLIIPFIDGGVNPRFVRVSLSDHIPLDVVFMEFDKKVSATAVSGPSPILEASSCDLVPLVACALEDSGCEGEECTSFYGYDPDEVYMLKIAAGDQSEIGDGNFHTINLPDASGGADLRRYFAGGYGECLEADEPVETKPGDNVGPLVQGINTRFYEITAGGLDPTLYPPDYVPDFGNNYEGSPNETITIDDNNNLFIPDGIFTYADYQARSSGCPEGSGCNRRNLTVAIGQCDGTTNGSGMLPLLSFGCFFLLQPVVQKGNEARVFGQFVEGCNNYGSFNQNPGAGPAPTRIILYKDPDSADS